MRRPPIWPMIWAASSTTGRSALAGRAFSNGPAKWTRRHRKLMAVVGATGLVLAVALAAAVFQYTIWLRRHGEDLETEAARANRNADLANHHRRLANRHLHAAQLRLASAAIENGQLERAQDILHDQVMNPGEDDPRDFAWHVLWERATRQIAPLVRPRAKREGLGHEPRRPDARQR